MISSEVRMWISVIIIALALGFAIRFARGETPEEWWRLAVTIQNNWERLDADEQRFIKNVINRLAVSPDAVPTPDHAHWLRNIKKRLDIR